MKHIKTAKFMGRTYRFDWCDDWDGICDMPGITPELEINIKDNLSPARKQEVVMHEMLHVCLPKVSHKMILRAAKDITKAQRRMGLK